MRPQRGERRRVGRWLGGLLVLGVAAAALGLDLTADRDPTRYRAAPPRSPAYPTPTAPTAPTGLPRVIPPPGLDDGAQRPREDALRALLARRTAAVRSGDRAGWDATVSRTPGARRFRVAQAALFQRIRALPRATWVYDYVDAGPALPARRVRALGGAAAAPWVAHVVLHYRLAGFDPTDVERHHNLTVVRAGGAWSLAGDTDVGPRGFRTQRDAWDIDAVGVVEGRSSLVVGAASAATLRGYAAVADRAAASVTAVWGRGWARRAVIVVPRTTSGMAVVLDRDRRGLEQVAAITAGQYADSDRPGAAPPTQTGSRVVLNPSGFARLSRLGRRVVMTHELTHVAGQTASRPWVPLWLSEGFADYVGYRGTGVPVRVAAADVLDQVRAGSVPARLPTARDFDPARGDISPAYAGAWLACRLIASRYGEKKLVAFYQAVSAGPARSGQPASAGASATTAAMRRVLGVRESAFVAAWRAYLVAQAAR